jgi:hypothetical protein
MCTSFAYLQVRLCVDFEKLSRADKLGVGHHIRFPWRCAIRAYSFAGEQVSSGCKERMCKSRMMKVDTGHPSFPSTSCGRSREENVVVVPLFQPNSGPYPCEGRGELNVQPLTHVGSSVNACACTCGFGRSVNLVCKRKI